MSTPIEKFAELLQEKLDASTQHRTRNGEQLGFDCPFSVQTEGDDTIVFTEYSPAGQDLYFTVLAADLMSRPGNTDEIANFIEDVEMLYENYDVNYEVKIWLEAKENGVSGVPDAVELVADVKAVEDMLQLLSENIGPAMRDFTADDWAAISPQATPIQTSLDDLINAAESSEPADKSAEAPVKSDRDDR